MNFLKSAANAATAAAKMASESAKRTYADLKAYPTTVRCSACPQEVDVPPAVFDWTCVAGHVSKMQDELCLECKVAQPVDLPAPIVTCPSCQAVTPVPLSNAKKGLKEAAVKTKEFAVATAAATKAGVQHLRAAPTTFHCAHCNTLLAVPTGPWACQTCCCQNEEESKVCKQCGQKKSQQKAICGVCRQSTEIPSTNFADGLKAGAKELHQGSKKVYYNVAGKPFITCGKCSAHVSVEAAHVSARAAAASSSPAAAAGGDASQQPASPSQAQQDGESAASAAPGGASLQAEGHYHGEIVCCPNCKNPIEN